MDPMGLIGIAKSAQSIDQFVSGNGLPEAVARITGDVHLEAACHALEMTPLTHEPRARINAVITHLEAAHAAYTRVIDKAAARALGLLSSFEVLEASERDVWVCSLMALCYAHLEEPQAALKSLEIAETSLDAHMRLTTDDHGEVRFGAMEHILAGVSVASFLARNVWRPAYWNQKKQFFTPEEFHQFRDALQAALRP